MQKLESFLNKQQYSNSNKDLINSNSTVEPVRVIQSLTDLIPDDGYHPYYISRLRVLGYTRFMELAQKARAGSDTPQRLFCWMLKNNELVQ